MRYAFNIAIFDTIRCIVPSLHNAECCETTIAVQHLSNATTVMLGSESFETIPRSESSWDRKVLEANVQIAEQGFKKLF